MMGKNLLPMMLYTHTQQFQILIMFMQAEFEQTMLSHY